MKIGLVLRNSGRDAVMTVQRLPKHAEDAGFDSLWFTDHIIGARSFEPVYEVEWLEALTALSYVAASTSRAALGVSVLVAPYRDAVYAAKVLSSIDNLSGGRLIVGIGTGWSATEYRAVGRIGSFVDRGAVTNETLEVFRQCWGAKNRGSEPEELERDGAHFAFRKVIFAPTPRQENGPPLWIGGQSGRALARAARYGDAWHPTGLSPTQVREAGDRLNESAGREIPRVPRISVEPDALDGIGGLAAEYEESGASALIIASRLRAFDEQRKMCDALSDRLGLQGPGGPP
jgi:probable F420-dependent oxidoreductase